MAVVVLTQLFANRLSPAQVLTSSEQERRNHHNQSPALPLMMEWKGVLEFRITVDGTELPLSIRTQRALRTKLGGKFDLPRLVRPVKTVKEDFELFDRCVTVRIRDVPELKWLIHTKEGMAPGVLLGGKIDETGKFCFGLRSDTPTDILIERVTHDRGSSFAQRT